MRRFTFLDQLELIKLRKRAYISTHTPSASVFIPERIVWYVILACLQFNRVRVGGKLSVWDAEWRGTWDREQVIAAYYMESYIKKTNANQTSDVNLQHGPLLNASHAANLLYLFKALYEALGVSAGPSACDGAFVRVRPLGVSTRPSPHVSKRRLNVGPLIICVCTSPTHVCFWKCA